MNPLVSVVICNYNHPELIQNCLRTMRELTSGVQYEVVVVDNNSDQNTVAALSDLRDSGRIDTLILSPVNNFFSEGNNIGVRNSNPESKYILLLNNDVAFLRSDWLEKMVTWMEGVPVTTPTVWGFHPTVPSNGPRDIVSCGWSYDNDLPYKVRPEGWCCMIRRSVWQELSTDFPFHYGLEEMLAKIIRSGAKAGVLCNYASYMVHREGGSRGASVSGIGNMKRAPDIKGWYSGLSIESLDFTIGPLEHESYTAW